MNSLKLIFALVFITETLFSCSSQTQLLETKSNIQLDASKNQYVFDNDTVRIEYDFWANKGILGYRIFNKLDVPVYIDWKKSSFIQNGRKMDYWSDQSVTNTASYDYSYYRNLWLSQSSSTTSKPERILFLAPKSYIIAERFFLCSGPISIANNISSVVVHVPGTQNKSVSAKQREYDQSGSPLVFRNFLTYSLSEQLTSERYLDNLLC